MSWCEPAGQYGIIIANDTCEKLPAFQPALPGFTDPKKNSNPPRKKTSLHIGPGLQAYNPSYEKWYGWAPQKSLDLLYAADKDGRPIGNDVTSILPQQFNPNRFNLLKAPARSRWVGGIRGW